MKSICCVLQEFRFYIPVMILLNYPCCAVSAQVEEDNSTKQAKMILFHGHIVPPEIFDTLVDKHNNPELADFYKWLAENNLQSIFSKWLDSLNERTRANYDTSRANAKAPTTTLKKADHSTFLAAKIDALPKNAYGEGREFEAREFDTLLAMYEKKKQTMAPVLVPLDFVPSTMTIIPGGNEIEVKTYTIIEANGQITSTDGKPYRISLDENQMKDLGINKLEQSMNQNEIVVDSVGFGFFHYFIIKNGILRIEEPKMTGIDCGKLSTQIYKPESKPFSNQVAVTDKYGNLIIGTDRGIFAIIDGVDAELDVTKGFKIEKLENGKFEEKKEIDGTTGIIYTCSNSDGWVEFKKDKNGEISQNFTVVSASEK
jgi:hypothetical protein